MIDTLVLDRDTRTFTKVRAVGDLKTLCTAASNIIWVDVSDPTSQDFDDLAREFNLHPLAIEDCKHRHQRPKVEEYPGYYFIVLYESELGADNRLELRELNIFLSSNYLITVHSEPIRAIAVADRLWREWTDLADRGTGLLAYLLIDAVVDDYMPMLDSISDHLDELEDQIFEDLRHETVQEIFLVKKQLLFLRRAVTPLRDVFNTLLRREQQIFSRETTIYFQDVFDHLIRVADTIDTLRDLLGSTMDAYLSISGNRMNQVMKRLTAISTLLMSVTLIAGIYGMNFAYMPELSTRYGYVGALGAMLVVALTLYLYFRRIKWF
ncbi:MAG: magnesium/cobalt transporter CorA [Acidobacteria bacterium]|nr:magnesium/cobalt transporter CorA [Acidobacteriota bacterium]MCW5967261.1 magnesium/cobalt transporter CorA [Blastocatellales bacterium]